MSRLRSPGPDEDGKRSTHQDCGHADKREEQRPGQGTSSRLQRREGLRRSYQRQSRGDAEDGNAELQERVEQEWPRQAIRPLTEQGASERQPGEERAHAGRHRVDIDADHQGELLDPQDLIDDRGGPRREEQKRRCREAGAAGHPFASNGWLICGVQPTCGGCGTPLCGHRQ